MCAASPDPPRCSPYTRSRRSRPPAAPADTAAHRGSGGPTAAAITHRHVCLQPRGAVATAERCTLGTVVLFDPVAIGCRPVGKREKLQLPAGPAEERRGDWFSPAGRTTFPKRPRALPCFAAATLIVVLLVFWVFFVFVCLLVCLYFL